MKQIKWKKGYRNSGIDPAAAHAELERLRTAGDGKLKPAEVVSAAKNENSVLHPAFQWDGRKAASEWRLYQARNLIRSIEIVLVDNPDIQTRAYEVRTISADSKTPSPTINVYSSIEDILADPMARDELLGRAIKDALTFRRRYQALSELSQVFKAVDNFLENAI